MKHNANTWILALTLLASTAAWSAPKKTVRYRVKSPIKLAPITEIKISWSNDQGGRSGGAGQSWTLRPNGNVQRSESVSFRDSMDDGDIYTPNTSGSFRASDFARLAAYFDSARVLDLKPAPSDSQSYVSISVKRGGKTRSVVIPDDTPTPSAASASWVTLTLVNSITAQTEWKNPEGLSVNTGINGGFDYGPDDFPRVLVPAVAVLDTTGKNVGYLSQSSASGNFRLLLPPGTYRLTMLKNSPEDAARLQGFQWTLPDTVKVEAGHFTTVTVRQEKILAAP